MPAHGTAGGGRFSIQNRPVDLLVVFYRNGWDAWQVKVELEPLADPLAQ